MAKVAVDDDDPWAAIAAPPPSTKVKPLSVAKGRGAKPVAPKLGVLKINQTGGVNYIKQGEKILVAATPSLPTSKVTLALPMSAVARRRGQKDLLHVGDGAKCRRTDETCKKQLWEWKLMAFPILLKL
ncbi:hypothetical protein FF1_046484 [Malus domestica]